MNYEKKYLEALEKARQFSEHLLQEDSSSIVEYIFPELESERIRKWLIDWAKTVNWSKQFTITKEQVLAWLEKQGKQKPIEWSKEDERIYYSILADIRTKQEGSTSTLEANYNEQISWLKSLKQRIKGEKSMEQYISKSAVVTEIEKRGNICKKVALDLRTEENKDYYQGKAEAYKETLDLLDTLEVKEVDLDNELDFVKDAYYYFTSDERSSMKKIAKHFFELGLQRLYERRIKL